jgi:phosphoglycerate dehydrogenase-like enzyme
MHDPRWMSSAPAEKNGTMPLTIWCNAGLDADSAAALHRGVQPHRLIVSTASASNLVAGGADPQLEQADIAFGQPDPQQLIALPNLRWVHITSAGYTRYDTAEFRAAIAARNTSFTNSSSVYAEPCAQHVLAMIMAVARQLPAALDEQRTRRGWPSKAIRSNCYLLDEQMVLIYGLGAIGRRLAGLLAPLRMQIIGVRRSTAAAAGEAIRTVTPLDADALLPQADHVVNILPASPSTQHFFNADRLARMKPSAVFYNIGRGTTVDQAALLGVLQQERIAAAYLDVTDPEPLPPEHPLWTLPNCCITPHAAGGHRQEFQRLVHHFLANLRRFDQGKPLLDRLFQVGPVANG